MMFTLVTDVKCSEFDILSAKEPKLSYYIDDASILSRSTREELNRELFSLQQRTGYKIIVVTTRKLEFDLDAFAFSEKVFNTWYKSNQGSKSGLLLVVKTNKDGAVVGGKSFLSI